ncbi:GNAT family N-acetyltransferase [Corallococcus interemptor]|uniref:GNAT family N-acetyltransferase n=1 Tax=Corallococcus interemptor TaxID=2316720 RepID=UPI003D081D88
MKVDPETHIGEIGLNAVHPAHAGHGVGTRLYEYALGHMKRAGARVATVATGGDASHAAARRAYEKAGFHAAIPSVWLCRLL